MTRYRALVVDPPWPYRQPLAHRGAAAHYPCMAIDDLRALPIADVAAPDAHLYLWTTNAMMVEAHDLAAAWGFRVRTILTWVKPQPGMGYWFRNNTEHALFAVRGVLPALRHDIPTAFTASRGRHSAKPAAFFDLVEAVSPGPYLEIFGRGMARLGWTAIGNEIGRGGDVRDILRELAA